MASITPFLTAVQDRRSIYTLSKQVPIPNERVLEIVKHALKHAPSPYNVCSTRCMVLFGTEHDQLWQNAYSVTEQSKPELIPILGPKIKEFQNGYGTVLFFDDSTAYGVLPPRFQGLSKVYPEWEEHSSGMSQFIIWTALEAEGLGCSLQHYHPSITPYVTKTYSVPDSWKFKCQLVFGGIAEGGGPGPVRPRPALEEVLRVYGA